MRLLIGRWCGILESLAPTIPFAARPLHPLDRPAAIAVAAAAGAHGAYVHNHLAGAADLEETAEVVLLHGSDRLVGLLWFGARGNLVVIEAAALEPAAVARAVAETGLGWRIVLGPFPVVRALAALERAAPLVLREQVYCGMAPEQARAAKAHAGIRLAEPADLAVLVAASLQLNQEDLRVDPRRVNRGWLRESIARRIERGTTWVLGPRGDPLTKLDVGSEGPGGMVLEGVFTQPKARGQGLASGLVASVAARVRGQAALVCLHVASDNQPALAAYRGAGMLELERCGLLLRG